MKNPRLFNLQILQTKKKKKDEKRTCYLKIIKQHLCLFKRKKTPTELPKLKLHKVLNT